jgi:hypothetical protein
MFTNLILTVPLLLKISPISLKIHIGRHERKFRKIGYRYYFSPPYRQKHRRLTLSECGGAGGQLRRPPAAAAAGGGGYSPTAVAVAGAACTATPAPQRIFLQTVYTLGIRIRMFFGPPGSRSGSTSRSEVRSGSGSNACKIKL